MTEKARLAEMLGVHVPEHWPGPDLLEALPFLMEGMGKEPSSSVWDGIIIHKADGTIIGEKARAQLCPRRPINAIDRISRRAQYPSLWPG